MSLRREAGMRYRIYITGESLGDSSEMAQSEYLRFRDSLSQSPMIDGIEDPSFIQIREGDPRSGYTSRVSFSIEYVVKKDLRG